MSSTMLTYEIIPDVGIGPVKLGATRGEVWIAMGVDPAIRWRFNAAEHHWHESAFQVHFEARGQTVEFIEVAKSDEFVVLLDGIDVHRTSADEVVAFVSRKTPFDPNDAELGYSFVFPSIQLSFWRPVMPESVEDPEGQFFEAVGLGVRGYFSRDGYQPYAKETRND